MTKEIYFDYDHLFDVLYIKGKAEKIFKTVDLNDLILDIDKDGKLVAIEVLNISKLINRDRKYLSNLGLIKVEIRYHPGLLEIVMVLKRTTHNKFYFFLLNSKDFSIVYSL